MRSSTARIGDSLASIERGAAHHAVAAEQVAAASAELAAQIGHIAATAAEFRVRAERLVRTVSRFDGKRRPPAQVATAA